MPGIVVGRYRLLRPLGQGGMGAVWRAHDTLLDRQIALKEIYLPGAPGPVDPDDPLVRRALREAQAAARLHHPGIVTVHDVVTDEGRPWIVMELVDGQSLAQAIQEAGLIPAPRTAEIGLRVLDALRAAHREGVLHRDVKPANILLAGDRVVLTDFGIAAIEDATALTGTGQLIGSPAYLAPERINGMPATAAADLWALGVTLYTAVTGRSPFQRDDTQATLAAILTSRPAPPAHAGRLWPVIKGLLVKDPARRLTAEQALKLLENVAVLTGAPPAAEGRRWSGWRPGGFRRPRSASTGVPETVAAPPPTVAAPTAYQDPPAAPPPPTAAAADTAPRGADRAVGVGPPDTVPGGGGVADAVLGEVAVADTVPSAPPVAPALRVRPVRIAVLAAALGVLAAGALWIAGPGSRDNRDDRAAGPGAVAGSPGSAGPARITMGFSQVGAESGWRVANTRSIREAATAAGVELTFADAGLRQEKQIAAIRSFIAQRVDVIAFSPVVLSGWGPVLREAKAANIPVILTYRAVDEADTTLYRTVLGSDFVLEGRRAGEWLVTQYRGGSRVVKVVELRGSDGSAPADDRRAGFAEAIKGAPNLRVIASQSGEFTRAGGKEVTAALLKAHPDIDVLYAHNDDMGLGAIEAIQDAGRKPGTDIKIITVDAVKDGMTALSEGKINFIVECSPLLGPQLMDLAKKVKAGETVEPRVLTEETTFTQEQAKAVLADRKY
jgi:ABC-type sugar transport system substrate-binding protein